jgi:hypothetical protein
VSRITRSSPACSVTLAAPARTRPERLRKAAESRGGGMGAADSLDWTKHLSVKLSAPLP